MTVSLRLDIAIWTVTRATKSVFIVDKTTQYSHVLREPYSPINSSDVACYRARNAWVPTIFGRYLTTRQFIVLDTRNPRARAHFCSTGPYRLSRISRNRKIADSVKSTLDS